MTSTANTFVANERGDSPATEHSLTPQEGREVNSPQTVGL
jgi:hypothetical protein